MYNVDLADKALKDIEFFKLSGNKQNLKKIEILLTELEVHPMTGTGKPERLRYELSGKWSRRIDSANRLIYEINDNAQTVFILSARAHYK
ncbi:Txe/YoeB family addiction module toxin [Bacteroidia bacterium]|nr:Txe/YoeB family addiction module toxin [Bacteroidia bacterium]